MSWRLDTERSKLPHHVGLIGIAMFYGERGPCFRRLIVAACHSRAKRSTLTNCFGGTPTDARNRRCACLEERPSSRAICATEGIGSELVSRSTMAAIGVSTGDDEAS